MKFFFGTIISLFLLLTPFVGHAASGDHLGRLYVDDAGTTEWLWYVDPLTGERALLPHGPGSYQLLAKRGLGITDADLEKIPLGYIPVEDNIDFDAIEDAILAFVDVCEETDLLCLSNQTLRFIEGDYHVSLYASLVNTFTYIFRDSDGDGVSSADELRIGTSPFNVDTDGDGHDDGTEIYYGYDPLGPNKLEFDSALVDRLRGRVLLQMEDGARAWYVHPEEGRRYPLEGMQVTQATLRALAEPVDWSSFASIPMDDASAELGLALQNGVYRCKTIDCFVDRVLGQESAQFSYTLDPDVSYEGVQLVGDFAIDLRLQYVNGIEGEHLFIFVDDYRVPSLEIQEALSVLRSKDFQEEIEYYIGDEFLELFLAMSEDDQEQFMSNVASIYDLIIADINELIPYSGCLVEDREMFATYVGALFPLFDEFLSGGQLTEDRLFALEDQIISYNFDFDDNPSLSCTVEGGFMSLSE